MLTPEREKKLKDWIKTLSREELEDRFFGLGRDYEHLYAVHTSLLNNVSDEEIEKNYYESPKRNSDT